MPNITIDNNRNVSDNSGQKIGQAGYDGQVRDGWRDRGKIEGDRYTDEFGRDRGWVTRSSSSGRSSGSGEGGLALVGLLLIFGIFYLMYLGFKWLVVEGKKSLAHASRSWSIASLFFPPFVILGLIKGYQALDEIKMNGGPAEQEKIAKVGIYLGYFWAVMSVVAIIGIFTSTYGF